MDLNEWKRVTGGTFTWLASEIPCSTPYPSMLAAGKAHPSYKMACRIEQVTGGMVPRTNWYPEANALIGQANDISLDKILEE